MTNAERCEDHELEELREELDWALDEIRMAFGVTRDPRIFIVWLHWLVARALLTVAYAADAVERAVERRGARQRRA